MPQLYITMPNGMRGWAICERRVTMVRENLFLEKSRIVSVI